MVWNGVFCSLDAASHHVTAMLRSTATFTGGNQVRSNSTRRQDRFFRSIFCLCTNFHWTCFTLWCFNMVNKGPCLRMGIGAFMSSSSESNSDIANSPSQKRPHQPDYPLLHEIMRHAIHVSETLTVAAESTESLLQQYEDFMAAYGQRNDFRRGASNPFRFPLQMIRGTYLRSESNKARIQNETTLVG